MSLMSRMMTRQMGLPPARTRKIDVDQGLRIPMPDGVELLADRYYPRAGNQAPLVLVRGAYGRATVGFGSIARVVAEQGFQVLLQSVRGTHDSGGEFEPGAAEAADGLATVTWMRRQPWYPGSFATYGASYLGYTQWALAMHPIPDWTAAAIAVAPSDWRSAYTHLGGFFSLGRALLWIDGAGRMTRSDQSQLAMIWQGIRRPRRLRDAELHLPMREADKLAVGNQVDYYQRWIACDDRAYAPVDFRAGAANLPPVHLAAGWHDFFLTTMLTDYQAIRAAGVPVRLVVGPGKHESGQTRDVSSEIMSWLAHPGQPANPVKVYVMGADRWTELADWPPPEAVPTPWYLDGNGRLGREPYGTAPISRYHYDPADPTPDVGGAMPDLPHRFGPTDQRALEARSDVLTFTTEPLEADLEIIGSVDAELYVGSTLDDTDFFAKLCDVSPNDRSVNICDGIVRLHADDLVPDADGVRRVRISLAGTAYCFARGHRIRLQVSSGAHPRFTRNLGTGEPTATGTTMRAADQRIHHDPSHPSAVILPIRGASKLAAIDDQHH